MLRKARSAIQLLQVGAQANFPVAPKTPTPHSALLREANPFSLTQLLPKPPTGNIHLQQSAQHFPLGAKKLPRARVQVRRPKATGGPCFSHMPHAWLNCWKRNEHPGFPWLLRAACQITETDPQASWLWGRRQVQEHSRTASCSAFPSQPKAPKQSYQVLQNRAVCTRITDFDYL